MIDKISGIVAGRTIPPDVALLVFESDPNGNLTGRKFLVECSEAKFYDGEEKEEKRLKLKRNDVQVFGYLAKKHNNTDIRLNEYITVEGLVIGNITVLGKDYKSFPAIKITLSRKIVGKIKLDDEKILRVRG